MPGRSKASTDGAEAQSVAEPQAMQTTEPPPPADPVPATLEQKPADNMSAHIVHAEMLANETQIKIAAYESGIITLQSELNGAEQEKNKAIAKIEAEFAERSIELTRRIDDLTLTKEMLTGSLVVRDRRRAERDDAARTAAFEQEETQQQ